MMSRDPMIGDRSEWAAGYDMGRRHGYEAAVAELLRILGDRLKEGVDIGPLLPLVDELRENAAVVLDPQARVEVEDRRG